jgi:O-acetyl-ADP-ribose deacetylase (regulator of RNase III)
VTNESKYIAASIFEKYPYANIYAERANGRKDTPGQIIIRGGDGGDKRYIINLLGQYYPGKAKYSNDSYTLRAEWFRLCLDQIYNIHDLESVAFPWRIGCGASGGDWNLYKKMIDDLAVRLNGRAKVYIYKLYGE